jgi:Concanavalin A-like lectin/glucanases superfamily/Divergent InlB B-repeat domain
VLSAYAGAAQTDRVLYMTSAGRLDFGVQPGATQTIQSSGAYNDGSWHFVVATQGSDGMRIYVDGQLVASGATANAASFVGQWQLGGSATGWPGLPASAFSGDMSDAAMFLRELTASQVQAEYNAGEPVVPLPPFNHTLSVTLAGSGTGTAGGAGLDCPGACTGDFASGTAVALTATPATGSTFAGWSGACSGAASCTVTLNQDQAVTATFTADIPLILTSPPSNAFTTLSRKVGAGGTVTLRLRAPNAGRFTARATFVETITLSAGKGKHDHKRTAHRTAIYGAASGVASGAGPTSLRLSPSGKALALLKSRHTLHVTIVVTFIPTGGSARRTTEHAAVTVPTRGQRRDAQRSQTLSIRIAAIDAGLGSADPWVCGGTGSSSSALSAGPLRLLAPMQM